MEDKQRENLRNDDNFLLKIPKSVKSKSSEIKSQMFDSPIKYAQTVSELTSVKSPRKRKALESIGLHPAKSRRKLKFNQ